MNINFQKKYIKSYKNECRQGTTLIIITTIEALINQNKR